MIKQIIMFAVLLLVIGGVLAGLFAASARKVEIVSADISKITDLGFTGVTIEGEIEVYNGGFLPIIVDMITYTVVLEGVEGIIGMGNITGGVVMPKEEGVFPVVIRLEWVPSLDTAMDLILSEKTYAEVSGIVHIAELKGFIKLELPFTARANLEGYVEQFTTALPGLKPDGATKDVVDIIAEGVGDIIGAIGDVVGDLS